MKKFILLLPLIFLGLLTFAFSAKDNHSENLKKVKASIPAEPFAKPTEPRKMLIFSVTNGFRHRSIEIGQKAFEMLGKETGSFEVLISDDLANFEPENIKQFDAICFLNTTRNPFLPKDLKKLDEEKQKAAREYDLALRDSFMKHIKGGAGFVGIHSATDTFQDWPEYGEMINGYFDGHPWGAGTDVSIQVEPGAEKHPLVAHLNGNNLEFKEEIYQHRAPYDSSKVKMLLRLDPKKNDLQKSGTKRADNDYGVAWVRQWGEGRVFYCSLGHNEHIFWNPDVMKHYLGGIQYALGDFDVPTL